MFFSSSYIYYILAAILHVVGSIARLFLTATASIYCKEQVLQVWILSRNRRTKHSKFHSLKPDSNAFLPGIVQLLVLVILFQLICRIVGFSCLEKNRISADIPFHMRDFNLDIYQFCTFWYVSSGKKIYCVLYLMLSMQN